MLKAIFTCIFELARTQEALWGAITLFFGAALNMSGIADIPLWAFLAVAVATLFVMAVRLQMKLDGNPHIEKLRNQSYMSFKEICAAIPKAHEAYDRDDVRKALLKALEMGHFRKLRITEFDSNGNRTGNRPDITRDDMASAYETGKLTTPGAVAFARAQFKAAATKSGYAEDHLLIDRRDYQRWYRRFRNHRYAR